MAERSRVYGGKRYYYTENVLRKRQAEEEARSFRKAGNLVRIVPVMKSGYLRPVSYDIFVCWKKGG